MNERKAGLDTNEDDVFAIALPDAVLEAAACTGPDHMRVFTVAMCTGNTECPF